MCDLESTLNIDLTQPIGPQLRALRLQRNVAAAEVARRMHTSPSHIYEIESLQRGVTVGSLLSYLNALELAAHVVTYERYTETEKVKFVKPAYVVKKNRSRTVAQSPHV